ncbi:MAG: recombinase family protein [Synergistaceae bacterium]|nr:recombinase family protein [Synergistaceae bacterium]
MSKIYGYCRISTQKQNIERQVRNILKDFPDAIIIQETFTGAIFQGRKELEKFIRYIQAGDTIVFDSVSRMSRNAEEGFRLYEKLYNQGVNLVFLKEPHINTVTYRKTLQDKKISLTLNCDDEATDKLMKSILDALNYYIMTLAKKQIQLTAYATLRGWRLLTKYVKEDK